MSTTQTLQTCTKVHAFQNALHLKVNIAENNVRVI